MRMTEILMTMSYLAFIEGLGEEGLVPLKDASRVRKLIQLLDVIVLDIGPEHHDDDGGGGADDYDGGKLILNVIVLDIGLELQDVQMFRMMMLLLMVVVQKSDVCS